MTAPKTDPANPNVPIPPDRIKKPADPEPIVDQDAPPSHDPEDEEPATDPSRASVGQHAHAQIDPSKIFAPPGLGLVWAQRK